MHTAAHGGKDPAASEAAWLPGFYIICLLPSDAGSFYSGPFNLELAVASRS